MKGRRRFLSSTGMRFACMALAAAMAAVSCATAAPPTWTVRTPEPDSTDTYFTGAGMGGTAAEAERDATASLVASVMQYMGTSVTVETNAVAKASIDDYRAELTQSVATKTTGRLAGFRVKDKYVITDRKKGTVQVYILAAYSTAELARERRRINDLLQEKIDAVAKPEAAGDALVAQGQPFRSVGKYVEAALAASAPDVDNARQKVERNLSKARSAVESLHLAIEGPSSGETGRAPAASYTIRLYTGQGNAAVAGAGVALILPRALANGRMGSRTELLTTDQGGSASFMAPAPNFSGVGKVNAGLALGTEMDMAYSLPAEYSALVASLENAVNSRTVSLDWKVGSLSRSIPLVIAVYETDESGRVPFDRPAGTGLMEALRGEGFSVSQAGIDPQVLLTGNDAAVLAAARSAGLAVGGSRLAYGSIRILSITQDGSMRVATASGTIRVLDLVTGALLHASTKTAQGLATTDAAAAKAAMAALGKQVFARDLAVSLP